MKKMMLASFLAVSALSANAAAFYSAGDTCAKDGAVASPARPTMRRWQN